MTTVLVLPPKLSCNNLVSGLSLYGMWFLFLLARADMQLPRVAREELIYKERGRELDRAGAVRAGQRQKRRMAGSP